MGKLLKYGILLGVLLLGWFGHMYYYSKTHDFGSEVIQVRTNDPNTKFINPLILVLDRRNIDFDEYKELKKDIANYIDEHINRTKEVEDIAIYFRDLNGGEWVGVNEDHLFAPSSMLKVVTLVAYSKLADLNPEILLEKVRYNPEDVSGQNYPPTQLSPGFYTVKELLYQMIVESDNQAFYILNNLHTDEIIRVYEDLQLPDISSKEQDFMSPRSYSRIFRTLYNGGYISRYYSNQILELLTHTKFDNGLAFGVGTTTLAHKFGELTNKVDNKVMGRELHDCGVVYYPGKPYFICVMTKGENFSKLETVIRDLSKITFDYIKSKE